MATMKARVVRDDRRGDDRTEINRTAVLRLPNDAYDIHVSDLTRDGCKFRGNIDLETGSSVVLGFAGVGHAVAQIIWRDKDTYGCAFDEPLPSGAVTAATRNNIDQLSGLQSYARPLEPRDVKWPRRRQVALIFGSATLLWALIIGTAILLF